MKEFFVGLLHQVVSGGSGLSHETQSTRNVFPEILIGHTIITSQFVDNPEETVEIDVIIAYHGAVVDGSTSVIHELVELRHKMILFFARLVIGTLQNVIFIAMQNMSSQMLLVSSSETSQEKILLLHLNGKKTSFPEITNSEGMISL